MHSDLLGPAVFYDALPRSMSIGRSRETRRDFNRAVKTYGLSFEQCRKNPGEFSDRIICNFAPNVIRSWPAFADAS